MISDDQSKPGRKPGLGSKAMTRPGSSVSETAVSSLTSTLTGSGLASNGISSQLLEKELLENEPDLLVRFKTLRSRFAHLPRRGNHHALSVPHIIWPFAQAQLFLLAQAVGQVYLPHVQRPLDKVRREILTELRPQLDKSHKREIPLGHTRIVPIIKYVKTRWEEIQLTPELSEDKALTGLRVSQTLAKRLTTAHRLQISGLTTLALRG